ncbi:MAG: polysaccharide export protein [Gammaproteobacteria bacterium]|nr:polysaccharide export protein [Gammaproteobacteria bacterium]MDH3767165.1 polysaccharide export protein [Gammaproteobacteria bacterium]
MNRLARVPVVLQLQVAYNPPDLYRNAHDRTLREIENVRLIVFLAVFAVTGCAIPGQHLKTQSWKYEPATPAEQSLQPRIVRLSSQVVASKSVPQSQVVSSNTTLDDQLRNYEYQVGPRDILIFTVWDHPELTIPAGEFRAPDIQGHLVSSSGDIFFPYVGEVHVGGNTLAEIRGNLTSRLSRYINNPQLDVRIAGFRSKRVNVTGEVVQPGFFPITDTPMTLVEALNLSGGPSENSAIQKVTVLRDGKKLSFDMVRLLHRGDLTQNTLLQNGDVVYVPKNSFFMTHVMGAVINPGTIPMPDGQLNLAEALSSSGGINEDIADASRLFVFRNEPEGAAVYWLDAKSPDAMLLATQFGLMPQDVVYVATSNLARWNRVVSLILPTIQSLWQTQSFIDRLND